MIKRADWLVIAKDRAAVMLLVVCGLATLAVVLSTIIRVHASDVQVPTRYSGYGTANIYRDQWYSLYMYPLLALLILAINGYLAIKIYQINRLIALGVLGYSLFIEVLCLVVANAIFNLAPSV